MALREYPAGTAFPGVIGRTAEESSPARNVLWIVLDDTGCADVDGLVRRGWRAGVLVAEKRQDLPDELRGRGDGGRRA